MFALYKICHNPALSVGMYHLSDIYFLYKNIVCVCVFRNFK